jgi:ABC-2 type transport system permease protein
VLVLHGSDSAELVVHRSPPWRGELQALLNAARHQSRLRSVDLTPEELADLLAPVRIALTYQGAEGRLPGRAERVAAGMAIALMLMGVFVGTAYLFSGITGEKQLRVTELVVSAISPQAWIDGKILGLSALSLVLVLNYAVSTVLVLGMSHLFGPGIAIPGAAVRPAFLAQFVVLGVLGFFFWFAFFAAIAATIDDPNSSARTTWLLFPVLTLGVAFLAVRQPDALVFRVLGVLPFTSPTVLPARWMLSEVALWEFLVAVALLVPSIWLLRRAAGKIFALGMLTYGKEPEWREMWRWVKEA